MIPIDFVYNTTSWLFNPVNATSVYAYTPGMDVSVICQISQTFIIGTWFSVWLMTKVIDWSRRMTE